MNMSRFMIVGENRHHETESAIDCDHR
jgi:hypothetical protein